MIEETGRVPGGRRGQVGLKLARQGEVGEALDENQSHDPLVVGDAPPVAFRVPGGNVGMVEVSPLFGHPRPAVQQDVAQAVAIPWSAGEKVFPGGAAPRFQRLDSRPVGDPVVDHPFRPAPTGGNAIEHRQIMVAITAVAILIEPLRGARVIAVGRQTRERVGIAVARPIVAPARDVVVIRLRYAALRPVVQVVDKHRALAGGQLGMAPVIDQRHVAGLGGPVVGVGHQVQSRIHGLQAGGGVAADLGNQRLGVHLAVLGNRPHFSIAPSAGWN